MQAIGPPYIQALEACSAGLVDHLDREYATRRADRGTEPKLGAPRPDGPLAGLPPVAIVG
jgi:hypothetical protein